MKRKREETEDLSRPSKKRKMEEEENAGDDLAVKEGSEFEDVKYDEEKLNPMAQYLKKWKESGGNCPFKKKFFRENYVKKIFEKGVLNTEYFKIYMEYLLTVQNRFVLTSVKELFLKYLKRFRDEGVKEWKNKQSFLGSKKKKPSKQEIKEELKHHWGYKRASCLYELAVMMETSQNYSENDSVNKKTPEE